MKRNLFRKYIRAMIVLLFVTQISFAGFCQVEIKGPQCVVSGNIYSYQFISDSNNVAGISKVCMDGGVIYSTGTNCLETDSDSLSKPISYVYVRWNDSTANGSITATSSAGAVVLDVSVVPQMKAGKLDTITGIQYISYNTIPTSIICATATGGNCDPSYSYWWEQSSDNLKWTMLPNATDPNLAIDWQFTSTTYFRRRVTELKGNSTAYSDAAIIFVDPDMTGH